MAASSSARFDRLRGEGRPAFKLVEGGALSERLRPSMAFLFDPRQSRTLFGAAYMDGTGHMGFTVLRKALIRAEFRVEEEETYRPWVGLNDEEAFERGKKSDSTAGDPAVFAELLAQGDPAAQLVMDTDELRQQEFADIAHDSRRLEKIAGYYQLLMRSVHADLVLPPAEPEDPEQ